jgi:hypothetical protein
MKEQGGGSCEYGQEFLAKNTTTGKVEKKSVEENVRAYCEKIAVITGKEEENKMQRGYNEKRCGKKEKSGKDH